MTGIKTLGFIFVALVVIHAGAGTAPSQKPSGVSAPQQQPDAKAEQIVKDALEVMGGQSYLNVRSRRCGTTWHIGLSISATQSRSGPRCCHRCRASEPLQGPATRRVNGS